jgi:hypothetical protein
MIVSQEIWFCRHIIPETCKPVHLHMISNIYYFHCVERNYNEKNTCHHMDNNIIYQLPYPKTIRLLTRARR